MGRYIGPACRICRAEGMKLFLKGARCRMSKCAVEVGRPAPGAHGKRPRKLSDYGVQLREKQRLRRSFGMQERQFRVFFQRALHRRGVTGEALLQLLELRLDNLVYRFGFAPSRRTARQLVRHGHITVNGHKVTIPSIVLKQGSVIEVRNVKRSQDAIRQNLEIATQAEVAPWLTLDRENLKGAIMRVPTREEIAPIVNEQLVVELYSR